MKTTLCLLGRKRGRTLIFTNLKPMYNCVAKLLPDCCKTFTRLPVTIVSSWVVVFKINEAGHQYYNTVKDFTRSKAFAKHGGGTASFIRVDVGKRRGESEIQTAQNKRLGALVLKWLGKVNTGSIPPNWVRVHYVDYKSTKGM